ncbi:hypothetical protein [Breoghania sp.]|nr:hypothetical protein [Breoghania sp.]
MSKASDLPDLDWIYSGVTFFDRRFNELDGQASYVCADLGILWMADLEQ